MSLKFSRVVIAVVLLSTWLIGGFAVSGPAHSVAKSNDFSAAAKVLTQSGTVGKWTVPTLPSGAEVNCNYPSATNQYHVVEAQSPAVYPATGLQSQSVSIRTAFAVRLPDGSLKDMSAVYITGTATTSTPFQDSIVYTFNGDLGSTFVIHSSIRWITNNVNVSGEADVLYTKYQTTFNGSKLPITDACYPKIPASLTFTQASYTVGAVASFNFQRMASYFALQGYIDGKSCYCAPGSADVFGNGTGGFTMPALPMGPHTFKLYRWGRSATGTFIIKPRIKVIPNSGLHRGQTVNISLRGYAAHETVHIRWLKNGSYVQINQVTTSSTGSANIDVKVPSFAVIGTNSVRGDGTYGHAQTNAVTVVMSAPIKSSAKASPTPTQTATPEPTSTTVVETATPEPTATVEPTQQPATPEATVAPTETVPDQPAETETPTVEPTEDAGSPTETPAIDPTVVPTETPQAEATEGSN
jgi:hypothetical protein